MANQKLASSASVIKSDAAYGCFYSTKLDSTTDTKLYDREAGTLVTSFISAIKTYVAGSGDTDAEAVTANLKYVSDISDEGITTSISEDNTSFNNMDGDVVLRSRTSRDETVNLSMIDTTAEALKAYYGETNVSVTDGVMTVHHNGNDDTERIGVFLLALSDGRRMCRVIPHYTISEHGDETLLNSELWAHEITLGTLADANGDTIIDYIAESADTNTSVVSEG